MSQTIEKAPWSPQEVIGRPRPPPVSSSGLVRR